MREVFSKNLGSVSSDLPVILKDMTIEQRVELANAIFRKAMSQRTNRTVGLGASVRTVSSRSGLKFAVVENIRNSIQEQEARDLQSLILMVCLAVANKETDYA